MSKIEILSNGRFKCKKCDKDYSRADNAQQHHNEKHLGKLKLCTVCKKSFSTKSFSRHLKTHSKSISKTKKITVNLELDIDENGTITSDIIDIEGKKFILMPVEVEETTINSADENLNASDILQDQSHANTEMDLVNSNENISHAQTNENKTSMLRDFYENAIIGDDLLLSQSI